MSVISLECVRTHNLKNISLQLPRDKLTVITGVSGSGKSSLAFDTLFAEGQRRYVESLSAYARQFLDLMPRPDVQSIEGLSPAIAIDQQGSHANPRSTVGTVTELADYGRLLFARAGVPICPTHGHKLTSESTHHMTERLLTLFAEMRVVITAPLGKALSATQAREVINTALSQGYVRFRLNGQIQTLDEPPALSASQPWDVDVVVDRLKLSRDSISRLADSLEKASHMGQGRLHVMGYDDPAIDVWLTSQYACPQCEFKVPELTPAHFSPNNPQGACPQCHGTGMSSAFDPEKIVLAPMFSFKAGAIPGWDARNPKKLAKLLAVLRAWHLDEDTAWEQLTQDQQHELLFGGPACEQAGFAGIVAELEKLYHDAQQPHWQDALHPLRSPCACPACGGARLAKTWQSVFVGDGDIRYNWPQLEALPLDQLQSALSTLQFNAQHQAVADKVLQAMLTRLRFLDQVGLPYLTLDRRMDSLSGGETQRIRLASQLGSGLTGVLYVLDEPSIGLHPRDNQKLIDTLHTLRDQGNTLVVVEHDEEAMLAADYLIDMGPGAGVHGGEVVAIGTPDEVMNAPQSLTGQYLRGLKPRPTPSQARPALGWLTLKGATGHNLKGDTLRIPLGQLTVITGVSGSGKSSLIMQTLLPLLAKTFHRAQTEPLPFTSWHIEGDLRKVIDVDQKPIGRTPRSNPATYTGLMTHLRDIFANTTMARERGYGANRFSFNVKGGRCEACQGDGLVRMSMHFLPDIFVPCDTCQGQRFNHETLEVRYQGLNMADVLKLSVDEALVHFANFPKCARILQALVDVGLGYITLGQSATTLSGGEAQRLKLATELARPSQESTLFILDEPTTGLHFEDIDKLYKTLEKLLSLGHTVVMIEHHTDMIRAADWMIDLGPDAGEAGGTICFEGTPDAAKTAACPTGPYL